MFCKFCGKELNDDAKFCKYCGGDLKGSETHNHTQPQETYTPTFTTVQKPKKPFNPWGWIIAGVVLLIFIGAVSDDSTSSSSNSTYSNTTTNSEPETPSRPDYSLPHGTVLKESSYYMSGEGTLEISNGTRYDAVAKLVKGNTAIYSVYIGANRDYTIEGISDGYYELMFAQGSDWNTVTKQFNKNQSYSAFDETFDFITTEDDYYYYPPGFEVTLNPVVGGTAETSSVNPAEFNAY